jgi:hypothetical protein
MRSMEDAARGSMGEQTFDFDRRRKAINADVITAAEEL